MARGNTLRIGKGARCSVLVGNLRLTREVTQYILNPALRQHVTDLVAVRCANITRGGLTYEAIFFTSPLFLDLELHAAKRLTAVMHKGHANSVWDTPLQADGTAAPAVPANKGQEINTNIFNVTNIVEDIAHICAEGFEVDDNNEALPENVPAPSAPAVEVSADGHYQGQTWGGMVSTSGPRRGRDTKIRCSKTAGHLTTRPTLRSSPTSFPSCGLKPFCCPRQAQSLRRQTHHRSHSASSCDSLACVF